MYSYPLEDAARIAVRAVKEFVRINPNALELVEWVLFDDRTYRAYENALGR